MSAQVIRLFFLLIASAGFAQGPAEPRKLVAETNHSTIQFSVPISGGITRITGKFNEYSIEVEMTGNDFTKAQISAVIKVNSVNTGAPARDEDLKTKDFFETEKFPDITFVSDRIEKVGDGYIAHGQFQMHGVTKAIALQFRITGKQTDDVIGFSSRCTIKRSEFGVGTNWKHTTDDNFIEDEIAVEIDFWTKRAKK
jgi:polyisoprenoid-binding protein YceI